jgi:hypothetical protein
MMINVSIKMRAIAAWRTPVSEALSLTSAGAFGAQLSVFHSVQLGSRVSVL